ncbi:MAG TPA: carboxypeptidase regulatory-like domain-containing protein [Candidatus Ozemobacteraceae bacterium]|nr:carboxypeptidase regulatory-like domain-containing protein [Candidatus Ozemobacteraceae bacterium]
MFRNRRFIQFAVLALVAFLAAGTGCGLREAQSGAVSGRVVDTEGDVVEGALVYSIFNEVEKVYTGPDGTFYISELPAGKNRLVIRHADYDVAEVGCDITSNELTDLRLVKLEKSGRQRRITDLEIESVGSTSAVLVWNTYRSVACFIEYGAGDGYTATLEESSPAESHRFTIPGLKPDTLYHARVRFNEEDATPRISVDMPFRTTIGVTPEPPAAIRIQPLEAYGAVTIAWEPSPTGSTAGYRLRRRANGGEWVVLTTEPLPRDARSFRDLATDGGNFYEYGVAALSDVGAASAYVSSERVFMPGFLGRDLTIKAAESPVTLVSDLIVGVGANLFVEPGVEFRVAASDAFGLGEDRSRVEILVNGRAVIAGKSGAPVRFTPLDGAGARDHWAGIRFRKGGAGVSELGFVEMFGCAGPAVLVDRIEANVHDITVQYSVGGYRIEGVRIVPTLSNCRFNDIASAAVEVVACRRFDMTNAVITGARIGCLFVKDNLEDRISVRESRIDAYEIGILADFARSVIANTLIVAPHGTGVRYLDTRVTDNFLDHCTIDANVGVAIASGQPRIESNILCNTDEAGRYGISYEDLANPLTGYFGYNAIHGFEVDYKDCIKGPGAQSMKPDFVGGNPYDYHLLPASPLRLLDINGLELGRYGPSYR